MYRLGSNQANCFLWLPWPQKMQPNRGNRNLFNVKWQAVFPCDTVKEIQWKNQLVCLIVANAFKCRLILAATSACWQDFLHHNHNHKQKTLLWCHSRKDSSIWKTWIFFIECHFIYIFIALIFQCDASVCMPNGMLMNKAALFIAMDGLFMCTEARVGIALTFSITLPLYCKEYMMHTCSSLSLCSLWMILKNSWGTTTRNNFLWLNPEALSLHL